MALEQHGGKRRKVTPLAFYYVPVPENTTLLDILNIARWTLGLTTSLRTRKSNRLVNAAAENSPIRASHSHSLFFYHLYLPFYCVSLLGMAEKNGKRKETCSLKHLMKTSPFHLELGMDIIENKTRKGRKKMLEQAFFLVSYS